MSISYGWEKLHLAVHSLTGNGPQDERLVNAVVFNLIHIDPDENLPESMRDEFREFMEEMSSATASEGEGTIQATVNAMDEIARSNAIEKIISFYDQICRHREP